MFLNKKKTCSKIKINLKAKRWKSIIHHIITRPSHSQTWAIMTKHSCSTLKARKNLSSFQRLSHKAASRKSSFSSHHPLLTPLRLNATAMHLSCYLPNHRSKRTKKADLSHWLCTTQSRATAASGKGIFSKAKRRRLSSSAMCARWRPTVPKSAKIATKDSTCTSVSPRTWSSKSGLMPPPKSLSSVMMRVKNPAWS